MSLSLSHSDYLIALHFFSFCSQDGYDGESNFRLLSDQVCKLVSDAHLFVLLSSAVDTRTAALNWSNTSNTTLHQLNRSQI